MYGEEETMTNAVSFNAYRKLAKVAKESAEALAVARREGLAKIAASGRKLIVREDAVGAYSEARFWAHEYAKRLAAVHPEKAPNWSPNARKRIGG
jgi:ClpP class serine protease